MIEQLEYRTGQSDYLGQMWTWVSGVAAATLTGQWSDVERIRADRSRSAIHADRGRIEVRG